MKSFNTHLMSLHRYAELTTAKVKSYEHYSIKRSTSSIASSPTFALKNLSPSTPWVNLSQHTGTLSIDETKVLSLGMNFALVPQRLPIEDGPVHWVKPALCHLNTSTYSRNPPANQSSPPETQASQHQPLKT
ncbi:uncharacterized protein LOC110986044 [Acanthaster planci]|uniref:Uncharacterized protein LOC110986044 n=1 Tax=Acanthaster planci TaxID=133434 RepID=A0A8B7ZEA4_ACAPL|nr:uncharacterized protein LOC110986044 [Acanthaster planci]